MTERRVRNRAGFSLPELLVALLLTSVVGAAVTGVFVTQSGFFDQQQKEGMARSVSRGAMNLLLSELRMIDHETGVVVASPDSLQVRVPFAMGVVCAAVTSPPSVVAWIFPADSFAYADADFEGYGYRQPDGTYAFFDPGYAPASGGTSTCSTALVETGTAPGTAITLQALPSTAPVTGAPIFFYQVVTYYFQANSLVPNGRALWRRAGSNAPELLIAPFDSTARFRFFWGTESGVSQAAAPADLADLHGVELVLDGVSERPNPDGTYRNVPLRTAVYFKNRLP